MPTQQFLRRMAMMLLLLVGIPLPSTAAPAKAERPPNIIVIFSDDHGYADLGCQQCVDDVRTPHLDQLAADGCRMTNGYVTAPQCVPSRAGLITGRYQQRFGVEDNLRGPLPLEELTLAERLAPHSYVTGMAGKWHLNLECPNQDIRKVNWLPTHLPAAQGFAQYFCGELNRYVATHDLQGKQLARGEQLVSDDRFRVDVQTEAAVSFIKRNAASPFLFYLPYYAPHVPLEAPEKYLVRFPNATGKRRTALAMISAMDDGVGQIRQTLADHGLTDQTLIFFIGDNGAPTKKNAWDGSLNTPLVGEKGMVLDGGVRVPFVMAWPGTVPAGQVYEPMVSTLDVTPTVLAAVEAPVATELDGVNLLPYLRDAKSGEPHEALYWRWRGQAAIRKGPWKFVSFGREREYLFQVNGPEREQQDRLADEPELAQQLRDELKTWCDTLSPPGLPADIDPEDREFFRNHLQRAAKHNSKS